MPDLMPWGARELTKLKDDLDRHFEALCEDYGLVRTAFPPGTLRVLRHNGEWVLTCPLPGFEPEDVAVTVTGRVLSILAVGKRGPGGGLVRLSRELSLPFLIDQARADLEDGVLTVRLARQAPPEARAVPVACKPGKEPCPAASPPAASAETNGSTR